MTETLQPLPFTKREPSASGHARSILPGAIGSFDALFADPAVIALEPVYVVKLVPQRVRSEHR
jgi:hypothetical protein